VHAGARRYSILARTAAVAVVVVVAVVIGLAAGRSSPAGSRGAGASAGPGAGPASPADVVAAPGRVDVLHDPPLLYEPGERLTLAFDLVCPGAPCGRVTGALTLTVAGADPAVLTGESGDDHLAFRLPASATGASGFGYRAEFTLGDGSIVDYPSAEGTMRAVSISQATEVDLGTARFSASDQDTGDLVARGAWGDGPDEFGLDAQRTGPTSFDVDPTTGELVVLDLVNSRVVRVAADGTSRTRPIRLHAGLPDLAVAPDGTLDVLYANAAFGASVQQFGPEGGTALREIPLATPSGDAIRRVGDSVLVEADDSYWLPISRGSRLLSPEEQVAAATSGLIDGERLVLLKHLRELGNEVRVAESGPSGVRAWRLTGETDLGPVVVAAPLPDGRVAVVQSQFDNDHAQYAILTLGAGEPRIVVAPQAQYASLYDVSEFRLDGEALYQARSTEAGYAIYRYPLR
jgi:hypothetical protein